MSRIQFGFLAALSGWFTVEVGCQPWTANGQLRTADAVMFALQAREVPSLRNALRRKG